MADTSCLGCVASSDEVCSLQVRPNKNTSLPAVTKGCLLEDRGAQNIHSLDGTSHTTPSNVTPGHFLVAVDADQTSRSSNRPTEHNRRVDVEACETGAQQSPPNGSTTPVHTSEDVDRGSHLGISEDEARGVQDVGQALKSRRLLKPVGAKVSVLAVRVPRSQGASEADPGCVMIVSIR